MKKSLLLLYILLQTSLFAIDVINLDPDEDFYNIVPNLQYLIDNENDIEIGNLLNDNFTFIESENTSLNLGFIDNPVWIRFKVSNPQATDYTYNLEYRFPTIDSIDLYAVQNGIVTKTFYGGDRYPYTLRDIDYHNITYKLNFPAKSETTIYIRLESQGAKQIYLELWKSDSFFEKVTIENFLLGLYFGIMVALLLYNLMIFIFTKDITYLFYCLYMGTMTMTQMGINDFDSKFFWPYYPRFDNLALPIFYNLAFFFSAQFTRIFLETKKRTPILNKILIAFMLIAIGGIALTFTFGYKAGFFPVLYILAVFEPVVLLITGIVIWIKGYKSARYYTIAWISMIAATILFNLRNIAFIPAGTIINNIVYIGSSLEALFLSLALADRINTTNAEIIKYQTSFNLELEKQVKKSTRELIKTNKMLEKLSNIDGLTRIYNRRYFDSTLSSEWSRLRRDGKPLTLIITDIDFFKLYNDTCGHIAGDQCLRQVSGALESLMNRSTDVVARYGGEEFAIILPGTDEKSALVVAEKIQKQISSLEIEHSKSTVSEYVTLSIGVATVIPDNKITIEEFIDMSDKALYQSKNEGRNRISVFKK